MADMIPHQTIEAIVRAVTDAKERTAEAGRLLGEAEEILEAALGGYNTVTPHGWSGDHEAAEVEKKGWRYLLQQTGLNQFASRKRREETEEMIEAGKAPPLTVENAVAVLENVRNSAATIVQEAARDVYDWLRPHSYYNRSYRTNEHNKQLGVPKKIIRDFAIDTQFGVFLGYATADRLRDLDNLFSLLDGRGVVQYPSDSATKIREAISRKEWTAETPYFRLKWYKKGTLHIEILRDDLRDKLALIIHDPTLAKV